MKLKQILLILKMNLIILIQMKYLHSQMVKQLDHGELPLLNN